ncbi:MAG: UDP-glucose/GDP-mannose dehydrogenase family protein [Phycisphaeraceae bacterium]
MQITIVGTGYVGLVTGTCLANTGNDVVCLDVDASKIARLSRGEATIHELGLEEMLRRNLRAGRLTFTTDKQQAYEHGEIIFICVGTPSDEVGRADLSAVLAVASDVGKGIEAAPGATGGTVDQTRPKIVVVKSTVPVGTNRKVQQAIGEHTSKPYLMASNPEFLKEGAAIADFNKPDRVVVGVEDSRVGDRMRELYDPFVRQGNPIFIMDIPSAEMVKYAANTMLATKISFINEVAGLCEHYGADIEEVRRGMCSDQRIGNQFLYPGLGFGGSCFPKDVRACITMGEATDRGAELMTAVHAVNLAQRQRFIKRIDQHFNGDFAGKRIAIWGLAFKPGTDDMRDAPAVDIINHLTKAGAEVCAFDPVAMPTAQTLFDSQVTYADDTMATLAKADALVICTDWAEFRQPDFDEMKALMAQPVVFDGRNLYRPDAMRRFGFSYYSIGRADVVDTPLGDGQAAGGGDGASQRLN